MPQEQNIFQRLILGIIPPAFFVIMMWIAYGYQSLHGDLALHGVLPRHLSGLKGIFFSPFIHGDMQHLLSNTPPIFILGTCLLWFYRSIWFRVFVTIFLFAGIGLWMGGRESYHIGASGLVYGLAAFLIVSGMIRREAKLVAISLLMIFLYGGLIWGIFPILIKVSFEAHLFGMLAGIIAAYLFRHDGREPKKLYKWEQEEINEMMDEEALRNEKVEKIIYHYTRNKEKED